ncbi:tripartite-type tricarboxylate transporter receptor subunit TctC [Variovorax boronicumulans]|uniref:Bug family tripartite tricarboxylate transporter substrate binding protein n=1 Tax=Variovorax boronicumulans TaxID=436515 RepID=UPI0027868C4F|nr:tripartite tricarboxylate transporter substrate binding protein [Variovorax boronicumulans]MDQ0085651.1 tripartite-type tricarboxylate transporter receptor subunit TctC [Variovorax boronicumulans]
MTAFTRRDFVVATASALALQPPARAQSDYPSHPIQLCHGFGAGGNADVVSRLLAQKMQETLKQPVVVEIKSGAGGLIATDFVAKARPDGYNIVMLTGAHTVSAALRKTLPYEPVKDFAFVSTVTSFPFVIAVRAEHPARNLAELLATARQAPERVTFTSVGVGSTQHMVGELLGVSAGVRLLHVPYRGGGAPVQAVIAGDVDILADTLTVATPHIQSGRLRALAVTSAQPWPSMPEVPAVASVLKGFEIRSWLGLAAPGGTPPQAIERLDRSVRAALGDPGVKATLASLGSEPAPSSPVQMKSMIERGIKRWSEVVTQAGIPRQ